VDPMVWAHVRDDMRRDTNRTKIGTFPTTGMVMLWTAMRLCGQVSIFGFGDGRFDCARRPEHVCAKYGMVKLYLQLRGACAKWNLTNFHDRSLRLDAYQSDYFHDMGMEQEWIDHLVRRGIVRTECRSI